MCIDVVMPVYNGSRYLHQAIESILAQKADFVLTISDDNSRDDSVEIIESFKDDRIMLIKNTENKGIFGNLNRCIAITKQKYIQVFSQDDVMLQGFLESQKGLLEKFPDAGLVYGSPEYIDENGTRKINLITDTTPTYIEIELYKWISSHYISIASSISSIMIPRSTIDKVGVFSEKYPLSGDVEFYNRVCQLFPCLRNSVNLHQVRGHSEMTSALIGSGPGYLDEEICIESSFKQWWSEAEWEKIRWFRAYSRGLTHLGWIKRLALRGQVLEAATNYHKLTRLYPQHILIKHLLSRMFMPGYRPSPKIKYQKTTS